MAGLQYSQGRQGQDEQKWGVTFARKFWHYFFYICFLLNLTFKTVKNISVEALSDHGNVVGPGPRTGPW